MGKRGNRNFDKWEIIYRNVLKAKIRQNTEEYYNCFKKKLIVLLFICLERFSVN